MKPNFAYIHEVCGRPAFYLEEKPEAGQFASAKGIHHPNGKPVEPGTRPTCGSCGALIGALSTKAVREVDPQLRSTIARVQFLRPPEQETQQEAEVK